MIHHIVIKSAGVGLALILTSPCLKIQDSRYGALTDSESISKNSQSVLITNGPDNINFGPGEFVHPVAFPKRRMPFSAGVPIIVPARSCPQMIRMDTSPVVASRAVVKDTKSLKNGTKVQNPTRTMGVLVAVSFLPSANSAVPIAVNSSSPNPTRLGFSDLGPKAFKEGWGKPLRSQVLRRNLDHTVSFCPFGLLAQRAFPF